MDKDYELKNDPRYQTAHLRERVQDQTKSIRDCGDEMKEPRAKTLPDHSKHGGKNQWNKDR